MASMTPSYIIAITMAVCFVLAMLIDLAEWYNGGRPA